MTSSRVPEISSPSAQSLREKKKVFPSDSPQQNTMQQHLEFAYILGD